MFVSFKVLIYEFPSTFHFEFLSILIFTSLAFLLLLTVDVKVLLFKLISTLLNESKMISPLNFWLVAFNSKLPPLLPLFPHSLVPFILKRILLPYVKVVFSKLIVTLVLVIKT